MKNLILKKGRGACLLLLLLSLGLPVPSLAGGGDRKPLPSAKAIKKLPADGGKEFNRLIFETSPYLLQHARNPVDWYPWGDEAFALAKENNMPIFLSVGYSTCHWCHVMEKESFEDQEVADLLKAGFVAVKVDREERPDLDRIYMRATQILRGSGGWPNSVWLTPQGKPFFAGTYFAKEDRHGQPGFKTVLSHLHQTWQEQEQEVRKEALRIEGMIRDYGKQAELTPVDLGREQVDKTLELLAGQVDPAYGGYGESPKFPPHQVLKFLLYEYRLRQNPHVLAQAEITLRGMARGGIHDQVGGGFHRYATDRTWHLPHFEKMLYDNAQLAPLYLEAYALTGHEEYRQTAEQLFEWVEREMTSPQGGFYSAQDADTEGEEGKFYVWTYEELLAVLGKRDTAFLSSTFAIHRDGNFEDEADGKPRPENILSSRRPTEELSRFLDMPPKEIYTRLATIRKKLLKARQKRTAPHLDDKILTSWNGLMIGAYARGGEILSNAGYLQRAEKAADFLLKDMLIKGKLRHSYSQGQARIDAYLEDYAYLTEGLLDLYRATGNEKWLKTSAKLADRMIEDFSDPAGGFYFTSASNTDVLVRTKTPWDEAVPSPNGVAARVLLRLAHYTGEDKYLQASGQTLDSFSALMGRSGRGMESLVHALAMTGDGAAGVVMPAGKTSKLKEDSKDHFPGSTDQEIGTIEKSFRRKPLSGILKGRIFDQPILSSMEYKYLVFELRLKLDKGWHINSRTPLEEHLKATNLVVAKDSAGTLAGVEYPEGELETFAFSPQEPLSVYGGETVIRGTLEGLGKETESITLVLHFQACNDQRCLLPVRQEISLDLTKAK